MADWSNTTPPTITGNRVVGGTLTANPGVWSPTPSSYTYIWERADDTSGTNREVISGATGGTYTIDPVDTSKQLRVGVYPVVASGVVYFSFDPSSPGNLLPWAFYDKGDHVITSTATAPNGGTSVGGAMQILNHGTWGKVVQSTVNGSNPDASGHDRVDLYNGITAGMFNPGNELWFHYELIFPAATDANPYNPSGFGPGVADPWNVVFHNDNTTSAAGLPSCLALMGATSSAFNWNFPGEKYIMRFAGGVVGTSTAWLNPTTYVGSVNGCAYVPIIGSSTSPLLRDHKYDVLIKMVCSPSTSGGSWTVWVDGNLVFGPHTCATLVQTSGGHVDVPSVDSHGTNYRPTPDPTRTSTLYGGRFKIASTQQAAVF